MRNTDCASVCYLVAADAILFVHFAFVVFVISGLLLIFAGRVMDWSWVRNPWFRLAHLVCIAVVVLQSWLGVVCPLTSWEMALRVKAGDAVYTGSFIAYWLGEVLYYQAPPWAFTVSYTLFGLLVLFSWFLVPPRPFGHRG